MKNNLPGSNWPAFYIKIKDAIYLVIITGHNMEKIPDDKIGFRSNMLC